METITIPTRELIALLYEYYRLGRVTAAKHSDESMATIDLIMKNLPKLNDAGLDPLFNIDATQIFINDAFHQLYHLPVDAHGVSHYTDQIGTYTDPKALRETLRKGTH